MGHSSITVTLDRYAHLTPGNEREAAGSELLSNDVEEWIDAGDEVIAVMHIRARGRRSGVPVERREWDVWTLRDGKLWRLRIYATKSEALEAVGLSE